MGQRPGLTSNMLSMFLTRATSQEPMGALKEMRQVHGAFHMRRDMSVTAPVSHSEMWPCAASALAGLLHH